MPILRAVVVHKARTGVPKDNVVNTFHFLAEEAQAEAIAERVRDFFVLPQGGNAQPLWDIFSGAIAVAGHEVRVYPINEATGEDTRGLGFAPLHIEPFDHVGRQAGAEFGLPPEVALCLSYRNTTAGAVPPARRRGRIYLGPIEQSFMDQQSGVGIPNADLINRLVEAGNALRTNDVPGPWMIYSRPYAGRGEVVRPGQTTLPAIPARPGAAYPVTQVWVDNAWDTQRRRGKAATARTSSAIG